MNYLLKPVLQNLILQGLNSANVAHCTNRPNYYRVGSFPKCQKTMVRVIFCERVMSRKCRWHSIDSRVTWCVTLVNIAVLVYVSHVPECIHARLFYDRTLAGRNLCFGRIRCPFPVLISTNSSESGPSENEGGKVHGLFAWLDNSIRYAILICF